MKTLPEWINSIRALATLLIVFTFCMLAVKGKVDPKDVMLIATLVLNHYFLKQRSENGGNDDKK